MNILGKCRRIFLFYKSFSWQYMCSELLCHVSLLQLFPVNSGVQYRWWLLFTCYFVHHKFKYLYPFSASLPFVPSHVRLCLPLCFVHLSRHLTLNQTNKLQFYDGVLCAIIFLFLVHFGQYDSLDIQWFDRRRSRWLPPYVNFDFVLIRNTFIMLCF